MTSIFHPEVTLPLRILLGGDACTVQRLGRKKSETFGTRKGSGANLEKHTLVLRFDTGDGSIKTRICVRPAIPFSPEEERLCDQLMKALGGLYARIDDKHYQAHFRTAVLNSAFDMAIARFLRQTASVTFGTIERIVHTFKQLTFQRYEGDPATSGLFYVPHPGRFKERAVGLGIEVDDFPAATNVIPGFFSNPLSYRLVSGTRNYYLANGQGEAYAVASLHDTVKLDYIALCNGEQFNLSFMAANSDRAFAIRVTPASEVQVLLRNGSQFLWRNNCWHLFQPQFVTQFLTPVGVSDNLARELAAVALAMSEVRHGTVILIAKDCQALNDELVKGTVGSGKVSTALAKRLHRRTIADLRSSGELLGLLSSDGVVHISPDGYLLQIGMIVNTALASPGLSGGGRTLAASAASNSRFGGRVIKVSQDGSIDLFSDGAQVYRFG